MSRWVPIYATTPSGKTLFVCLMCGRKSPTPDKTCPEIPEAAGWKLATTCAVLEEIEEAAFEVGERPVRLGERIMVGVMKDGTALAQWQSESGDCKRVKVQVKDVSEATQRLIDTYNAQPLRAESVLMTEQDAKVIAEWNAAKDEGENPLQLPPKGSKPTFKRRFERTPEGHINNCSLANGESEKDCQICNGHCPDRRRYK